MNEGRRSGGSESRPFKKAQEQAPEYFKVFLDQASNSSE